MYTTRIKSVLNALKCPICRAPVDLAYFIGKSAYGCAANVDHYHVECDDEEGIVLNEFVRFYDDQYKYEIIKSGKENCLVILKKVDGEKRIIFSFKERKFEVPSDYFDFKDFDVKKAVTRVQTLLTFS